MRETAFRLRGAAKKIILLMAGPLKGGGVVKGRAIKEKITFFSTFQRSNGH